VNNKLLVTAVTTVLYVTSLSAMQFQTLGYKSVAMGGAGVASSSSSIATYNNPALLAKVSYDSELSIGGGISAYDHGAGASLKELDDSGFIDTLDKANNNATALRPADATNLIKGKNIVLNMNGDSLEIAPQAYLAAQINSFGVGIFVSSDIVATAVVDPAHKELIFKNNGIYAKLSDDGSISLSNAEAYTQSSIEFAITNGKTYVQTKGIALAEIPVAYGYKFELSGGNLMVGGSFKYMQGNAYLEQMKIDNSGSSSTGNKLEKKSTNFGVDLGLAYEPSFSTGITLAIVAKNLNSPDFNFSDGSKVTVDPMIRAGVAYNIFESLEFAADMDLTKNETFISSLKSQMLGGGLNYHPASWFAIRGGLMNNMDGADKADLIYTAGIGIGLKWLQIDLSAQISSNSTTVENTTYPQYAKINLALISRW